MDSGNLWQNPGTLLYLKVFPFYESEALGVERKFGTWHLGCSLAVLGFR